MVPVTWSPTPEPLVAEGVVARGAVAGALARRLLETPESLDGLRGVAAQGLLVLLGPADALPFVDGVIYVGRAFAESRVRWPTTLQPSVDAPLVERAAVASSQRGSGAPWVWLPLGVPLWCSVARAERVGPATLDAFARAEARRGTAA